MSIIRLKTAATAEPVSVTDLKLHCAIDTSSDDTILGYYIKAARRRGELLTGAAWVESTWEQVMEDFPTASRSNPRAAIELLRHPVPAAANVTSVAYLDSNGVSQTLTVTTHYKVVIDGGPMIAKIYPAYGYDWPEVYDDPEAVTITFRAGWPLTGGTTVTTPEDLRAWLMMRAAGMYENRESIIMGQAVYELPRSNLDGLLDAWSVPRNI